MKSRECPEKMEIERVSGEIQRVSKKFRECPGEIADLNAVAQFSSDQTENFCNNHQSHSSNNLILHDSLWIRGRKHSVRLELDSTG